MLKRITVTAVFLCLLLTGASMAQQNTLVGLWSMQARVQNGQPFGVIYWQFNQDGKFHERILLNNGQADYFGEYKYDTDRSILQWRILDYQPKETPFAPDMPNPPPQGFRQVQTGTVQFTNTGQLVINGESWNRQQ